MDHGVAINDSQVVMCSAETVGKHWYLAQHFSVFKKKYSFFVEWWNVSVRLNYN